MGLAGLHYFNAVSRGIAAEFVADPLGCRPAAWLSIGRPGDDWYAGGLPIARSELQADYTRLFVGPDKVLAPLWESVHYGEERLTFQEETLDVRRWYQRFGLEVVNLYHEPDDHIGLELAFLAHLAGKALAALEAGDQANFHHFLQAQKQFLVGHPLRWVFDWCALVEEQGRTDFYRGIALLVRGALLELHDQIVVDLPIDMIGVTA